MDGFSTTAMIRDPSSAVLQHSIPIIAMTAYAIQGDRERCQEAGMDDYISKPVNENTVLSIIDKFCKKNNITSADTVDISAKNQNVFNYDDSIKRLNYDQELLIELLKIYFNELPDQCKKFKNALVSNDPLEAEHAIHSIKSSSQYIGADRLGTLAQSLESSLREGTMPSVGIESYIQLEINTFVKEIVNRFPELVHLTNWQL
jgi:CheY-like chemotaxis protein